MRPLKLTMSAFGPYMGKETIDFETLGKSGLFLITGNTGAGKTTVFDGISYALFGEPSGTGRDARTVRNMQAAMEEKPCDTYVEFEFEYKQKRYKILRNPEYERPAKRGGGTAVQKADCVFTDCDGKVITGNNAVLNKVKELLGIDREQFRQIVMLAQGDFQRLLFSSTDDKSAIFRKLFDTGNYNKLQLKISEEYNAARGEYAAKEKEIQVLFAKVTDGEPQPYEDCCKSVNDKIFQLEQRRKELEGNSKELKPKYDSLLEELNKIKSHNENYERYNRLIKTLEVEEKEIKTLQEKILQAQEQDKLGEKLRSQADGLKALLPQYVELERIKADGIALRKEIDERTARTDEKKKQQQALSRQLEQLKKRFGELSSVEQAIGELKAEADKLKDGEAEYQKAQDALALLNRLKSDNEKALREYADARKQREQYLAEYNRLYNEYFDAQAGIMAQQLNDGEPCPVCGSKNHPSPAKMHSGATDQQQVEQSKQRFEKSSSELEKAGAKAASCKTACDNASEHLVSIADKLGISAESENISRLILDGREQNSSKLEKAKKELSAALADKEMKDKLSVKIPQAEEELKKLNDEISALESESSNQDAVIRRMREECRERLDKLEYKTLADAKNKITALEKQSAEISENSAAAKKAYEDKLISVENMKGAAADLESRLDKKEPIDTKKLEEEKLGLEQMQKKASDEEKELFANVRSLCDILKDAKQLKEQQDRASQTLGWLQPLWATINGQTSGKDKLNLETYVQAVYFERIIMRANRRLMEITDGRYELKRRETAENQRSKTGLDLDVIDHCCGAQRSVKTLSGGESFQAALALALGLSDEIQSMSGGIQFDTLFIDEGFGSLDEEALSQAITTLIRLSQSNRLVGIISHVSELKNRIQRQIVITKNTSGGSHAEIVV